MKANNIRQYVRRLQSESENVKEYQPASQYLTHCEDFKGYELVNRKRSYEVDKGKVLLCNGKPIALLKGSGNLFSWMIVESGVKGIYEKIQITGLSMCDIIKTLEEYLLTERRQATSYEAVKPEPVTVEPVKVLEKRESPMEMKVTENTLIITIDIGQAGIKSASGKSTVIESTRGNVSIPGTNLKIGLNIYRPIR